MSFTRTPAGLGNYRLFFGADYVVYIEGKVGSNRVPDEIVLDDVFYESLLKAVRPSVEFKVKAVGNCDDVVEHVRRASAAGDKYSFGVIDRDAEGILYSESFGTLRLFSTHGYSWESDLWTVDMVKLVFSQLSLAKPEMVNFVGGVVNAGMKRLGVLSRLDFATRVHGLGLIKKNRGSCGFAVEAKKMWGIPRRDVSRLIKTYRQTPACDCHICKSLLNYSKKYPAKRVVQGHLLESFACNVISENFRRVHPGTTLSHVAILNSALGIFREKVSSCLGHITYSYYESAISKFVP